MHLTILTAGTRGDTQPYVALAIGLQQAGYQVRVAAGKNYVSFISQYGLEFFPISADFSAMMTDARAQAVLEAGNPIQMLRAQAQAAQSAKPLFAQLQNDVWAASQNTDVLLFSPGQANGYYIARQLGIPCLALNAVPMTPTRHQPAALFYAGPRLGGAYNRVTHMIMDQLFWQSLRPAVRDFWKDRPGAPSIPIASPNARQRAEQVPVLYGYSEHVLPRPTDWPDYVYITGYWFIEEEPAWTPPPALVDFLRSGPPPVYIGFGSMGSPRQARTATELVIQSLALSGMRGILATGWNGLSEDVQLPETVYMLKSAPHTWLFPQMSAVVHHGGAGTTAAGLRAGVPSIIVPHGVDQPMWGRRVLELGVGPQPIQRKELTAERLAQAISATREPALRQRAAALGATLRAENGVARAVEIVERLLPQGR